MKVNQEDTASLFPSIVGQEAQITMDQALQRVGGSHYYQKRAFIYFGLQWLFANWILTSPVYLLQNPTIECLGNSNCLNNNCQDTILDKRDKCFDFICDQKDQKQYLKGESLILEFGRNLQCSNDQDHINDLLKAMPYVGSLIGFFIFSFMADNYGRRLAIGLSWFFASIGALVLGISQNFIMVGIGMFLTGFGVNPAITIQFSLFNEHTIGKFRDIQNIGVQVFYGVGEILIVGIAYKFQNWRVLSLYWFFIPIMIMNFGIFLVYESPNKTKATKILNKIAKVNQRPRLHPDQIENRACNGSERVYSLIDLVKFPSLRVKFVCGLFIFFAIQIVYYGLNFAMDDLGYNLYINALIVAIFETASYIFTDFQIVTVKRRPSVLYGMLASCVLLMLFQTLNHKADIFKVLKTLMAGIIRFVICFVFGITYTYMTELFPTPVRSQAMSIISAAGTVGSILCTFIISFAKSIGLNELMCLGIVALSGVIATIPLPETLNEPLYDKIEEEEFEYRVTEQPTEITMGRDTVEEQQRAYQK